MKYRKFLILLIIISAILVTLFFAYTRYISPADKDGDKTIDGATTISVSLLDDVVDFGKEVTVSINVEPKSTIAGMQFDLSFNPSLVSVDHINEGDLLKQDGAGTYFITGSIDNESGTITGVYGAIVSPGEAVSTEGTFASITLITKTEAAICPLTLLNVVVGDLDGNSVPVNIVNDNLEINQA